MPLVPCYECNETYIADVLHGRKLLSISSRALASANHRSTPGNYHPTPVDYGLNIAQDGIHHLEKEGGAVSDHRVSVFDFAEFCQARTGQQEAIVRKIRKRSVDPKTGFNYYGPLLNLFRRTHWDNNNLSILERALPNLLRTQKHPSTAENYRRMAEAYIDYWKNRATEFFPVVLRSPDVVFGDLTIRVNPEVGMVNQDGDRQILKMWLKRASPTREVRQIAGYLLSKLNPNPEWHPGIWDVKHRNVPLLVFSPDNYEGTLVAQAQAFLKIWEGLDQQARQQEL